MKFLIVADCHAFFCWNSEILKVPTASFLIFGFAANLCVALLNIWDVLLLRDVTCEYHRIH